jgi:hypothetical protein
MSQLSRTEWEALYGTTGTVFPDNTTGEISEGDMRTFGKNASDSIPFTRNDSYTWAFPKADTSGTNTYAVTLSPAITAYTNGMKIHVKIKTASTGASTLNANTVGARKIFLDPSTQADSGDLVDEQEYIMSYDSALDSAVGGWLIIGGGGSGGGDVDSVNGQTGVVQINADDVPFTPAGNLSATDVQAAIEELDAEKLAATAFAPYVRDQASASTAGATITLDMNSQIWRSFVGSATFATPKTMALSNTTNSLEFRFFFQITNVAAVLTFPSDWISADDSFNGTDWTPPLIGKYYMTGDFNDTSNEWTVSIYGPSA